MADFARAKVALTDQHEREIRWPVGEAIEV
jgi:hypothetical protein